ncbi:unnamed protein product [Eretmochelys imbricata]
MAGPLLPRALRAAGPSRLLARGAAGRAGPADPALQEVERVLQQQRKAVRLRRLRRELEPAGPPQRSLSWQAMEQIRYLRQAFPEEWPVARLAQGFGVSPDVIQRVLRSKFSPPLERRMKQDAKVLGKQGSREQQAGPDCRAEPGAISAGEAAGQLLPARPKDVPQPGALIAPGGPSSSSKPQRNLLLRRPGEQAKQKELPAGASSGGWSQARGWDGSHPQERLGARRRPWSVGWRGPEGGRAGGVGGGGLGRQLHGGAEGTGIF